MDKNQCRRLKQFNYFIQNNKLIAIPEVHNTTGYGEKGAACTLADAVTYWQEVKSALYGQEAYVIEAVS